MFDHVTIRVSDREASERLYTTLLRTLGLEPSYAGVDFAEWDDFSLTAADEEHPVTRGLHAGFYAPTREHVHLAFPADDDAAVDAFHAAATGAGAADNGAPAERPAGYYAAYALDPDGNNVEVVNHNRG